MSSGGSVSRWIGKLKAGDDVAAEKLWVVYFDRLVRMARKKLQDAPRRASDEEDVALSAFDSFCRGAERGRFPQLEDRDDLWRLLVVITARKAKHLIRDEQRLKRGGPLGPMRFDASSSEEDAVVEKILSREPSPELAAQVAEECQRLLSRLGDKELESVALWKMEGYTNAEIAGKLGCAPRSVERKLWMIRSIWGEEQQP